MQPERSSRDALFPSIGQAVLLVVAMLVLQVGIGATIAFPFALASQGADASERTLLNPWVLGVVNIIAIGAALAVGIRATGEPARRFLKVRPFAPSLLAPILLTSVSLAVVIDQVAKVFFDMMTFFPEWPVMDLSEALMTRHPIGGFIFVIIVAPFTEEYLFRGMILRGLLTRHRPVVAVVSSAVLFGLMHANVLQFQLGLVIGCAFGWWFVRTGSVGPGLVGHAVFNGVAYFSTVWPELFAPLGPATGPTVAHQPAWLTLSAVMFVALGILWFKSRTDALAANGIPTDEDRTTLDMPMHADVPPVIEIPPVDLPPALAVEATAVPERVAAEPQGFTGHAGPSPIAIAGEPPLLDPPVLPPESPVA